MNVLVTGASSFQGGQPGFMGGHFVDLAKTDPNYNLKLFTGDIRDNSNVARNLRDVDTVVNFAALTYMTDSWDSPFAFMDINYGGTLNLLQNHSMFKKFIQISTTYVYGSQAKVPIEIDAPTNPEDPYGVSKLAAEKAVQAYSKRYGFDALIVRSFNNFGPRQAHNFVIPTFCLEAIRDRKIVVKGDAVREFIYVKDNVRAIKCLIDNNSTGLVQISHGVGISVWAMAYEIAQIARIDPIDMTLEENARPWGIKEMYGSDKSLKEKLGDFEWTPMDDALQETYHSYER